MLRHALIGLALHYGSSAMAFAPNSIDEARKSVHHSRQARPAGDLYRLRRRDDVGQPAVVVVPIDANAAIDSNRYADPIKTNGRWVEEMKAGLGSFNGPETMSYEYRGATANGLLFFVAAYSGGGSRTFYYLHILDAASAGALDEDGSTYSRLNLTLVRTYVLGRRWKGDVSISGNSVRIVTNASLGGHGSRQ